MLAVTVTPGGSPALRELPSPTAPPGGILVRVHACGLCGSDVEKLRPGGAAAGSVLGHEIAGVVVGGALPAGLRVALAHHVPCGVCERCRAGHEPLCPAFLASALEPGGFCELTAASPAHVEHAVLPLPDHVSDLSGSFVEPLGCVLRGIEGLSGAAVVAGAGSIGLLAAQALRARGAPVRMLEPEPERARRAAELGFEAPAAGERFAGALLTAAAALPEILPLLEPGGQLVLFSGGVEQPLEIELVYRRELVVRGMRSSTPRHLREALALIASGAVECESLVDCVLGLHAFDDGLARYHRRQALKVVFAPVIAARFWAPRDVRVEHVAEPEPGAGEVVLRVEAALTCGTDAKCYRRGHPVLLGPAPAPFGHEYSGVVVACGEDAPFGEGDLVCGVNSAPCTACPACLAGREELCSDLYPLLNGAYAELLRVPARIARVNLHHVPEGVSPEVAAAIEPLACAVHGADDAGARPGQRIAILGRGPLGRLLALACEARGATAELLGRGEGDQRGYETVIEAAGSPEAWQQAIELAAPGGTVVLFGGLPRETVVPVDSYRLHYEALTLRGSFHHRPRDVRAALALMERAASSIARLLTHEFALADVVEPLRRCAGLAPRDGLLKAVIRP